MNSVKNITLIICLLFLIGCINFSSTSNDLKKFNLNKISIDEKTYPIVIIGGGIAGYTAAIYVGQSNIKNLLLEGNIPGGAITMSHSVCNWPGEKNISGKMLASKIKEHALSSKANILENQVISVNFSIWPYEINIKNKNNQEETIKALTCIVATGSCPIFLNIPGEKEYFGRGVSKCATCDGSFYKDKTVAVVGGGNTAITDCLYLSNIAKKISLIVRRDKLRASGENVNKILNQKNIEILYNTNVKEVLGDNEKVTGLKLYDNKNDTIKNLSVDGMFLAIGSIPQSKIFSNELELDQNNYIVLKKDQQTSKKGIFAAGDVCEPEFKQLIIAAGQGAKAAMQAQNFLEKIGYAKEKFNQNKSVTTVKMKSQNSDKIIDIKNTKEFEKEALNFKGNVIVDFYAHWCIPCKMMMPIVQDIAKLFANKIKFIKADVSKIEELAQNWKIRGVPTFIFLKNGKELARFSGGKDEASFQKFIEETFQFATT